MTENKHVAFDTELCAANPEAAADKIAELENALDCAGKLDRVRVVTIEDLQSKLRSWEITGKRIEQASLRTDDGTCIRCGAAPRNASGLCATCLDEDAERAGEIQSQALWRQALDAEWVKPTPPAPAATDEEVERMVERLRNDCSRIGEPHDHMIMGQAADLLARVARERDANHREYLRVWQERDAQRRRAEAAEKLLSDINDDTAVSWVHEEITAHLAKHAGGNNG